MRVLFASVLCVRLQIGFGCAFWLASGAQLYQMCCMVSVPSVGEWILYSLRRQCTSSAKLNNNSVLANVLIHKKGSTSHAPISALSYHKGMQLCFCALEFIEYGRWARAKWPKVRQICQNMAVFSLSPQDEDEQFIRYEEFKLIQQVIWVYLRHIAKQALRK